MKSKIISLSAISAALIAVLLTLGCYVEIIDLFTVVVASVFVVLPLYLKSYKGSVLCFLAGGILAFICSGFNYLSIIFPAYFGFLGLYPIIRFKLNDKKVSLTIIFTIGVIWCVATFYGIYYFYLFVLGGMFDGIPEFLSKYLVYIVAIVGIVFYFIYDRFIVIMRMFLDRNLSRIIK